MVAALRRWPFLLLVIVTVLAGPVIALADSASGNEAQLWESAKDSPRVDPLEQYLKTFPEGAHAAEAKARIETLKQAMAAAVAADSPVFEVRARHILVKTAAEAKEIIRQLQAGGDFAQLARTQSIETESGAQGGELGWFDLNTMVPEFVRAAFAMKPGQFTQEPVKTQFGYHVILVEDVHYLPPQ